MLHHQMRALRQHGISEFVIIRGYLGDRIVPDQPEGVRFVDNTDFKNNNILMSLFTAGHELVGGLRRQLRRHRLSPGRRAGGAQLAGAGGAHRRPPVAGGLQGPHGPPGHRGRAVPPQPLLPGLVEEVGKQVGPSGARTGSSSASRASARRSSPGCGPTTARRSTAASTPRSAMRQDAAQGVPDRPRSTRPSPTASTSRPCPSTGRWREIDTVQDLERAQAIVNW
jgi:hypothetical protein